jgi:subtilisin family serine protease
VSPADAQQLLGPTPVPPPGIKPEVIPGQYIVELKRGVGRDAFINEHRVAAFRRYTIINGFAARMSQQAADRLASRARVRSVTPDLVVHAFPKPDKPDKGGGGGGGKGGKGKNGPPSEGGGSNDCPDLSKNSAFKPKDNPEKTPTGGSRIGAESATATGANVNVAVLDTGIDPCHPDLKANFQGGVYFVESDFKDYHGHGTHVAGIIGASENLFGVVGVAPEAHLYAVKVLDSTGSGLLSDVIAGLDWAARNDMQVANLSLGGFDLSLGSGPMCTAVTNAVAKKVTVVVAAGNSAFETLFFTPANCLYSLTVSAEADSDGSPGGGGACLDWDGDTFCDETDDTFAESFSNWSDYCWDMNGDGFCTAADSLVVNLMAPGVEIESTFPTYLVTLGVVNYGTLTGTSMASPHVAGAAALYLQTHPSATPAQVRTALTTGGECESGVTPAFGSIICPAPWTDDPDIGWEPLLDASGL